MRPTPWALLVAALLCGAFGCDDGVDPGGPAVPAGCIQGFVRTGGLEAYAVVSASRIIDGVASDRPFLAEADERGFYSLDVPVGRYVVALQVGYSDGFYVYAAGGPGWGDVAPDTIAVAAGQLPRLVDFDLGGISLGLTFSHALDGRRGDVLLHRRYAPELESYARVYVRRGDGTIKDGRLELELPGVLPGQYQVEVALEYGGEQFWLPGTRERAESPWYRVGVDSVTTLSFPISTEVARIEGRVTGAWQAMGTTVAPSISVFTVDSIPVLGPRQILADGRFGIDLQLPGPVKLQVSQGSIGQWIGGPDFARATVYPMRVGETISGVDLVQSGLRLHLTAPGDGANSATVRFYDATDLRPVAATGITVESGQTVGIPNLWPGEFLMRVSPRAWDPLPLPDEIIIITGLVTPWRPQWFDRAATAPEARVITIPAAGAITTLDLTLELGGVISGAASPDPQTYFYAVLTRADDPHPLAEDLVWPPSLAFEFQGLPDGDYKVGLRPHGQALEDPPVNILWYPGTTDWEAAEALTILDAGVLDNLVIPAPPGGAGRGWPRALSGRDP